ncbi:exodeoxyribonuclease VII large subunit [Anopheles sinensis]|uniref:Exodeoxyribonuclease VII large subunit n=1 Tax=Anopheles sinensis TaxID=74873 RepID=A0A084WCV6_ANOSI|nr:exodeoxyribonuclease VII large subunit [Anopheles sinensis]
MLSTGTRCPVIVCSVHQYSPFEPVGGLPVPDVLVGKTGGEFFPTLRCTPSSARQRSGSGSSCPAVTMKHASEILGLEPNGGEPATGTVHIFVVLIDLLLAPEMAGEVEPIMWTLAMIVRSLRVCAGLCVCVSMLKDACHAWLSCEDIGEALPGDGAN